MSWRLGPGGIDRFAAPAAASFRGDFLEGLDLTGCYRYHASGGSPSASACATRVSVLGQLIERVRDTPDEALDTHASCSRSTRFPRLRTSG